MKLFGGRKWFGGRKLLKWKDPQNLALEGKWPKWKERVFTLALFIGSGIFITTCMLIGSFPRPAENNLSWIDLIVFFAFSTTMWAVILGGLSFLTAKFAPPTIIIRTNQIQYTSGQDSNSYWYNQHDFFDLRKAEELFLFEDDIDRSSIRLMILGKGDQGVATFEIAPEIDETELFNIMIKRLQPADAYFKERGATNSP